MDSVGEGFKPLSLYARIERGGKIIIIYTRLPD